MDDEAIVVELHPALRHFAAAVRPPVVDPDDLIQEALARTVRRTSLAEMDQPLSYLRWTIMNLAMVPPTITSRRTSQS